MTTSGDKLQIIGRVKGVEDKGESIKLTLEESDGSTWDWSNRFHPSEFRSLEHDSVHRFEVEKRLAEGKRYPYRNLVKYIGPADMPPSGEATSKDGGNGGKGGAPGGSGGGQSIEVKSMERDSIEAGNAVSYVLKLMEIGHKIDEIPELIDQILGNADTIIQWYSGHRLPTPAPAPKQSAPVARNGATNGATATATKATKEDKAKAIGDKPIDAGQLMAVCEARWKLNRAAVLAILDEADFTKITDFGEALAQIAYAQQEPPEETAA